MYIPFSIIHISRQLYVMYRFKNIFDIKEKEQICNTFILANFNYCPKIWHLCGKTNTKKIERIQKRALRFMFNDHCSTYSALLEKCSYTTLHVQRIKTIACKVSKSINKFNPVICLYILKIVIVICILITLQLINCNYCKRSRKKAE